MTFSMHDRRSATNVYDLLVRGKAAAKAGDREEAEFYLEWVLRTDSNDEEKMEAWLWLSEISDDPEAKRRYLEEILTRNPTHVRARRRLALVDGRLKPEEVVDPENVPQAPEDEAQPAGARRFACPRCSARMVFTPDGESLFCEHCGYGQQTIAERNVQEQDFIVTMATAKGHVQPQAMQAFSCEGCAASYLLAPQALSVSCPYCQSTFVVQQSETRNLVPPQGIIPFDVAEDEAHQQVNVWLDRLGVVGRIAVRGLYLPVWTFDIGGTIDWRGETGEYDSVTRSWTRVSGRYPVHYDDYLVPACKTLPERLSRIVDQFDLEAVVSYKDDYLVAWPAQTYEISVGDASLAARGEVLKLKRREAMEQVQRRGDVKNVRFSSAGMVVESYKLLLLPVWIAHYRYRSRRYPIVVNGQTGAVRGERPGQQKSTAGISDWLKRFLQ